MLSKARIKHIQSLRLGKFRKQHQQFVAEGSINVQDFLEGKLRLIDIYATAEWKAQFAKKFRSVSITETTAQELSKISALKTAPEVVAVFRIPESKPIIWGEYKGLILMLDDIRDPGNLGTIIRTADWFGIQHIICSKETADAYNPKVVQASMGSLARIKIYSDDLEMVLKSKPRSLPVYGAVLDGISIKDVIKAENQIILIGSEAHGISTRLLKHLTERITIPSSALNGAESLNAAIATAIICYEFAQK